MGKRNLDNESPELKQVKAQRICPRKVTETKKIERMLAMLSLIEKKSKENAHGRRKTVPAKRVGKKSKPSARSLPPKTTVSSRRSSKQTPPISPSSPSRNQRVLAIWSAMKRGSTRSLPKTSRQSTNASKTFPARSRLLSKQRQKRKRTVRFAQRGKK